jgi:spore germination cell wall hydrolase CwlJ-like protein
MNDATILEPGPAPRATAATASRFIKSPAAWAAGALLMALVTVAQITSGAGLGRVFEATGFASPARAEATVRTTLEARRAVASLTEGEQAEIVVQGDLAKQKNNLIPISTQPVEQARGFLLAKAAAAGSGTYVTALTCLTQAVYYEAGYELTLGKRAVAQVILNRMRHPAYPKSVCGVVYQGSERSTGCQFSFTCDGSLLRTPGAAAWRAAEEVARGALAGQVEPSVGTATHYHADYVLPKWAFSLAKIEQIGAHIFYRFPGGWGRAGAFSGGYSGVERIPTLDRAALSAQVSTADDSAGLPADIRMTGLSVPPHVTDRHTPTDVGGRINVTKLWRLSIPDPAQASTRYRAAVRDGDPDGPDVEVSDGPIPVSNSASSAVPGQ